MADLTAQRTLVKSPPELWTELSEVERLAKHLGELGEITITKVEPESTVAWEGEQISGTVALEQSGWGTKVTLTATLPEPDPPAEPDPDVADPEPTVGESEAAMGEPAPPESEPTAGEPEAVVAEPESEPEAAQPAMDEPERRSRMGFLARWLFRRRQPDPQPVDAEPEPEAVAVEPEPEEPEPVAAMPEPEPVAAEPEPVAAEPEPEIEPVLDAAPPAAERVQAILDGTLDALGQAHHRPFSRG